MKFLRSSLLMAAAVAITTFSSCAYGAVEAGSPPDALVAAPYHLRRDLAGSNSDTPAPTTTTATPPTTAPPPSPTTAPPPPPPSPTTSAPAPTTTSPATTAPAPTTSAPATTSPATTAPATTAPATTTPPTATTASPTTDATKTPAPSTAGPATTKPDTSGSTGNNVTDITEPPVASVDGSTDGTAGKAKKPAAGSSTDSDTSTSKDSKMSTGTIIGIVCGIVGGVAILAIIAVMLARKRRNNEDDDPLSPFELSMDKGYSGVPVMQNANQYGNNTNTINGYGNGYGNNSARTATNNSAMIGGAAAVGAGAGVGAAMLTTNTPQAGSDAAGVSYTQFYDVVTSPGSAHPQQRLSSHTDDNAAPNNDSNLWMSAMEPKDNDVEGASVPPEVSLPGDEYDDNNSSFISRNSYDQIAGSESIDIDQSSVLSGGSDLEKEFPDYEDESSRGSYEL